MTNTTFKTHKEAVSAGYTRGNAHKVLSYRGMAVYSVDVSLGNSFGYDFEIHLLGETLAVAESIWLTDEKNQIGRNGCFLSMYKAGDLGNAIARAKVIIDQHLIENPNDMPYQEVIDAAKNTGCTAKMYKALCDAADAGSDTVRRAKASGEPVFTNRNCWHHGNAQLELSDAKAAAEQMKKAGISW